MTEHSSAAVGADLREECIASEEVFAGKLLRVSSDRVRLPDGNTSVREYIRHPGAVVVVAQLDDGSVLLERQFRYPLQRDFIELPAGKIDAGEDILVCAQRELREETGYVAAHWQYIGVMHPCIGYSNERIEVFFASGLSQVGAELDAGEFLEVFARPWADLLAAIRAGEITDGKTLAAVLLVQPFITANGAGRSQE